MCVCVCVCVCVCAVCVCVCVCVCVYGEMEFCPRFFSVADTFRRTLVLRWQVVQLNDVSERVNVLVNHLI